MSPIHWCSTAKIPGVTRTFSASRLLSFLQAYERDAGDAPACAFVTFIAMRSKHSRPNPRLSEWDPKPRAADSIHHSADRLPPGPHDRL
jgi:hypothetical protein